MKRIRQGFLILLLIGWGCFPHAAVASVETQAVQESTRLVPSASAIERIHERGHLVAGVKFDFEPFGFIDEEGNLAGFDVDLVHAIAEVWGVEVEFVQVTSANRIPKLLASEVDLLAASMTHTKQRDQQIDFSQTYFIDGQTLLVRADSGIQTIQNLANGTVGAIDGSTSISQIEAYAASNQVPIEVYPFQEYLSAVEALKAGVIDALTTDSSALSIFAQDNSELTVVGGLFTREPYALGLPPNDSSFRDLINFTLQQLQADGTYTKLYQKWFSKEPMYTLETINGEWAYTFATTPILLTAAVQSRIESIQEKGFLDVVAVENEAPFVIGNEEQGLTGFDVDLIHELAGRWLDDESAVRITIRSSEEAISALLAGHIDLVIALPHTKEREVTIDFSQTYYRSEQKAYALGLPNLDSPFRDLVNFTLQALETDGVYNQLYQKWFGQNPIYKIELWPGEPVALPLPIQSRAHSTITASTAITTGIIVTHSQITQSPVGLPPTGASRFNPFTISLIVLISFGLLIWEKGKRLSHLQ